jgi:hypothetical protein
MLVLDSPTIIEHSNPLSSLTGLIDLACMAICLRGSRVGRVFYPISSLSNKPRTVVLSDAPYRIVRLCVLNSSYTFDTRDWCYTLALIFLTMPRAMPPYFAPTYQEILMLTRQFEYTGISVLTIIYQSLNTIIATNCCDCYRIYPRSTQLPSWKVHCYPKSKFFIWLYRVASAIGFLWTIKPP